MREEISDTRVLEAMAEVDRSKFVPEELLDSAYDDRALPIGYDQTISQPFIVAFMSQEAKLKPGDKVLEIGTGSGYQAAILSQLGAQVYSIEIIPELAEAARKRLLSYKNVHIKLGDGFNGWQEHAPFDAIVVTATAPRIPKKLYEQLKPGGRLLLPLKGKKNLEWMTTVLKQNDGSPAITRHFGVRFVPMTGQIELHEKSQQR